MMEDLIFNYLTQFKIFINLLKIIEISKFI